MSSCPSCHQPIEILNQHLGTLFTCPHCRAVFFVDWNGQPELAHHEPYEAPTSEENSAGVSGSSNQDNESDVSDRHSSFHQNVEQNSFSEQPVDAFAYNAETLPEELPEAVIENPLQNEYENSAQEFVGNDFAGEVVPGDDLQAPFAEVPFNSLENSYPREEIKPSGMSDSADFSDVTDFANANTTVGPLAYTVIIDGIDSSQLLHQLKEAMTDSRFAWNVNELMTHVGGGRLILNKLAPAKASVLINRIKYLPFKISWRQDVLSGS